MAITAISVDWGVSPRIVRITDDTTLAAITTAGYGLTQAANIQALQNGTFEWLPSDYVLIYYSNGEGFFTYDAVTGDFTAAPASPGSLSNTLLSGDIFVGSGANIATGVAMSGDATISNTGVVTLASSVAKAAGSAFTSSTTSATPGTIRALKGVMTGTNATMTSGNLVGVRGEVDVVGASGGFLYGAQGKVIATGTLSGSSWTAGIFGQFDISAATINAGQTACIWGDYGATSGTISDASGMRGIAMTNTTAAVLNAQDYRYGNATYLLELAGAGGTLNYYLAAGVGAGSAGDAAHCAAQMVIKIEVNGVAAYIPVFTQNT